MSKNEFYLRSKAQKFETIYKEEVGASSSLFYRNSTIAPKIRSSKVFS